MIMYLYKENLLSMTTTTIRKKLADYIITADNKKIKAIYTLVEKEIEEDHDNKWDNKEFIAKMERHREEYKNGAAKLYSLNEVEKRARQALKKAKSK